MFTFLFFRVLLWLLATFASTCTFATTVVGNTLLTREPSGANWAGYGRTFDEQRFSPLKQINTRNVKRLGLAWSLDLNDISSVTTVPLAVDGVIYFAASYSMIHAVDAKSGKLLWRYDPEVWKVAGPKMSPNWGSRGLALWKGRVYAGTADGRLIAVDAKSGQLVWSVMTVEKEDQRYITGAPKVFNGLVVIGHGGADFGPVRGYVTAYDAETGKQRWRFYTVPGNPAEGFENKAMEMAAQTWTGEWWKHGGGGTVWNAMSYDPEFNRIYLGTGNGAPWNQKIRSPGGGDNLFLCSVVALDADTGEYVWHYQTNPGETWDYNSAMDMVLADLTIEGKPRKVLMHAPKNGFFYVIDRTTGKLISAEKIVKVTWADRIDLATGRPVENPEARYPSGGVRVSPAPQGAHSWHPMAFNPQTGLSYVPVRESEFFYSDQGVDIQHWKHSPGMVFGSGLTSFGAAPSDGPLMEPTSALLAWNPRTQQQAWRVPTPGDFSGGVLTTAGKLVFQGDASGRINAYDAAHGTRLWAGELGVGTLSPPITYTVNGRQYVSILAGWMGGNTAIGKRSAAMGWVGREQPRRLLTFVLDGKGALPRPPQRTWPMPIDDSTFVVDAAKAQRGATTFALNCVNCHGVAVVAGGYAPDLRASPVPLSLDALDGIVRQGWLARRGMPPFPDLDRDDLENLRHYMRQRARQDLRK